MTRDPKRLLGGYATDSLTEEERRELLRAALDDQELFDAVLQEEGLRELLESPEARRDVLAALETPTAWDRVRGWFAQPATFGHVAALAAVLLAIVGYRVFFRGPALEGPPPAASRLVARAVSPATRARLLARPEARAIPASLELEPPGDEVPARVAPGEELRLRVSVRAPARVLLIAERPDGSSAQVLPPSGQPPALVERTPAVGPVVRHVSLRASLEPGTRKVRLVVAPVDVDLGAASPADVDDLASQLTLVDLTYEVILP